MIESRRKLLHKILLGEDLFLECKEVRFSGRLVAEPKRDRLADDLAAFANDRGGILVLGVEDGTREIPGIPLDLLDIVEEFVHELCFDNVKPPLAAAIERLTLPNSAGEEVAVIKIDVPSSLLVHSSPGGYLYRIGSTRRFMSPEYLARLFEQRSQTRLIRFDEQIVSTSRIEDLAADIWERFKGPNSDDDRETFLMKLNLTRRDGDGVVRPTVAGVLVASRDPRRWLPNAYVQAVAYIGNAIRSDTGNPVYQLDAADITGPLEAQIEGA